MKRFVDRLAEALIRHRAIAVLAVLAVGGLLAASIPDLEMDPSPEGLVASHDGQRDVARRLRARFGDSDRVVVLLVQAEDVLEPPALGYVHRLSRRFQNDPSVAHVDSVTVTPVGRRAPRGDGPTLDELEAEEDPETVPIEVHGAIAALARADPDRFEDGIFSVAAALASITAGPLIDGDEVTPAQAREVRRALAEAPLLEGRLISEDLTVAAVALELAGRDHEARDAAVERIERWIASHPPPEGVRVDAGGLPILRRALANGIATDQRVLMPLTLLICAVLLIAAFRWLGGVALSLATVGIAAAMVLGGMAAVGEPMNVLNEIVPPLLIVVGVTDAIHLVNRYREELRRTPDRAAAARSTLRSMATACFFTSATTAVGLGSLVVSRTSMLRGFGLLAAVGVMLAYVVTIAFLPAALSFLRPPRETRARGDRLERLVVALTQRTLRHRGAVTAGALALTVACAWSVTRIRVDSHLLGPFDPDHPAAVTTRLLEDRLQGARPLEVLFDAPDAERFRDPAVLATIDEAAQWAEDQPGVLGVMTATDPLHELRALIAGEPGLRGARFRSAEEVDALRVLVDQAEPSPLRAFLTEDGRALRMQVMMADIGARASADVIERLRARLAARLPDDIEIAMTGEAYIGSFAVESVIDDLRGSLVLTVLVIFGMLTLLFRSLRFGLLSVPPNLIPLVTTAAWMAWRDIPLDIATAIIFSIGLGLAVDGTIHVLARFREELAGERTVDEALIASARGTGRAIVISSVTLAVGFGALAASEIVPIRQFGELIAVTVASCLIATLVVLPPLLSFFVPARTTRSSVAPFRPEASDGR